MTQQAADSSAERGVPQFERLQFIAAHSLMAWFYNHSADEAAAAVFPGRHPSYLEEYAAEYARSYAAFFGKLDTGNQLRLVKMAIEEHGHEAGRYYDMQKALETRSMLGEEVA